MNPPHKHGTLKRAKTCGCMACSYCKDGRVFEGPMSWPLKPLLWAMGKGSLKELKELCGEETVKRWEQEGLTEIDSDEVAIRIARKHPFEVWRGWIQAGLDPLES